MIIITFPTFKNKAVSILLFSRFSPLPPLHQPLLFVLTSTSVPRECVYLGIFSTSLPRETAIKISSRFYSSTKFISTTVIFSSSSRSTGKPTTTRKTSERPYICQKLQLSPLQRGQFFPQANPQRVVLAKSPLLKV